MEGGIIMADEDAGIQPIDESPPVRETPQTQQIDTSPKQVSPPKEEVSAKISEEDKVDPKALDEARKEEKVAGASAKGVQSKDGEVDGSKKPKEEKVDEVDKAKEAEKAKEIQDKTYERLKKLNDGVDPRSEEGGEAAKDKKPEDKKPEDKKPDESDKEKKPEDKKVDEPDKGKKPEESKKTEEKTDPKESKPADAQKVKEQIEKFEKFLKDRGINMNAKDKADALYGSKYGSNGTTNQHYLLDAVKGQGGLDKLSPADAKAVKEYLSDPKNAIPREFTDARGNVNCMDHILSGASAKDAGAAHILTHGGDAGQQLFGNIPALAGAALEEIPFELPYGIGKGVANTLRDTFPIESAVNNSWYSRDQYLGDENGSRFRNYLDSAMDKNPNISLADTWKGFSSSNQFYSPDPNKQFNNEIAARMAAAPVTLPLSAAYTTARRLLENLPMMAD